jgi:hypothetical protein
MKIVASGVEYYPSNQDGVMRIFHESVSRESGVSITAVAIF